MNGMDAVKEIRRVSPCSKILGVSLHTQPVYAKKMLKNGAMGYVTKNSSREEMFRAIHELLAGKKYICDAIKNSLVEDFTTENQQSKAINQLTERELEIISYIREGKSSKEIAEKLYISVKTVEVHRYKILQKLDLKNAAALVNFINQHQVAFA
jgi:two-component system invasion response regulator UvrY